MYVQHFKCNIRDIRSGYPALHLWMRYLYWNVPAFKDSTNFLHIKGPLHQEPHADQPPQHHPRGPAAGHPAARRGGAGRQGRSDGDVVMPQLPCPLIIPFPARFHLWQE